MQTLVYLGTDPSAFIRSDSWKGAVLHYPLICTLPRPITDPLIQEALAYFLTCTDVIFTSKTTVGFFFDHLKSAGLPVQNKQCWAIGSVTAEHLVHYGWTPKVIAEEETQEGLITALKTRLPGKEKILLPHSARARPLLRQFLEERGTDHHAYVLYDTHLQAPEPKPRWQDLSAVLFTSPSTVEAFGALFCDSLTDLPPDLKLYAIGPITAKALKAVFNTRHIHLLGEASP
jgi:uroporphyrinogen III methyltransferase/synthase